MPSSVSLLRTACYSSFSVSGSAATSKSTSHHGGCVQEKGAAGAVIRQETRYHAGSIALSTER